VKALIDAGEIGAPVYVSFTLLRFPFRPGSQGWRYDAARIGSWLLEETVHFFDFVMWYFDGVGAPLSVLALGDTEPRGAAMSDNVTAILRFPGRAHAVISQTLKAFEYHQNLHVVGTEGAIRSWWSGAQDRTPHPAFELRLERRTKRVVETVPVDQSGEVVELAAQMREVVTAFAQRRPLLSGEEARKSIIVCLAAEQSLRENREITLRF
jgi:myo-inositol 2-dehydrogenase/D-chiro-inositol 1-dehydrogenase